jgi:hypothetical protein
MKKKFLLGFATGAATLAVAVPLLAQVSSAADDSSVASKPGMTQACVQALAARDAAVLSGIDAMNAARKAAIQARQTALTAAAALTDEAARKAAVQKANQDFQAAMQAARKSNTAQQTAMDAVKTACGRGRGLMDDDGMGGPGPRGNGPMIGKGEMRAPHMQGLAKKLGMTEDELQAALKSGKTIEQLAQEKGVTLPPPPAGGKHGDRGMMRGWKKGTSSSSAQ